MEQATDLARRTSCLKEILDELPARPSLEPLCDVGHDGHSSTLLLIAKAGICS
ncbi:MAG: hypothetical protein BIP78_0724 [Candidatus Bipolaricaulis sibiricus]|uniref:Uncharacterized protein n=1 Tax=Bipolaricaulis sibiricus TaxID=2501609 RepID=A0A410FU99_BIPS1|nr:MAG: hypothetical protein BIP78_0724 [Candidatus Bipolaricaulis sibiricus]